MMVQDIICTKNKVNEYFNKAIEYHLSLASDRTGNLTNTSGNSSASKLKMSNLTLVINENKEVVSKVESQSSSIIETSKVLVHLSSLIQIAYSKALRVKKNVGNNIEVTQQVRQKGKETVEALEDIQKFSTKSEVALNEFSRILKKISETDATEIPLLIKEMTSQIEILEEYLQSSKQAVIKGVEIAKETEKSFDSIINITNDIDEIIEVSKDEVANSDHIIKIIDSVATITENLNNSKIKLKKQNLELTKSKESLLLSEEKYRILVENSQDDIYSCNLDGVFDAVNKKFCEVIGLLPHNIIGKKIHDFIEFPEFIEQWNITFKDVKEKGEIRTFENKIKSSDGKNLTYYCTLSPIYDLKGKIIGITGTNHDITEIRENEETIKHLAYYDSLTDLPNRVLLEQRFNIAIKYAKRIQSKVAIIFLDFDDFKKVNDSLGHSIGDGLIKEVSNRFKQIIRKHETIARFGGDEFVIIIDNVTCREDIIEFIKRLRNVFSESFNIDGYDLFISSSIGISIYPDDGDNFHKLMKNADTSMYKAKEAGKDTYRFYHKDMMKDIIRKLEIERCLRNALTNNELVLHYQPQIQAKTGRIRGYEALLRWKNQELGVVSPFEFIPIAEDTGLIMQIGEWVLRTACRTNKEWQDKYGFQKIIAVNVSAVQLRQRDFLEIVRNILNETGIRPEYLELEITESVLIDSFAMAALALDELRNMGVKIALDDFGTGYSSLNYIKKLSFNTLKIDKMFVQDIKAGSKEEAISKSIISLSHNLGLEVIAEGVETKEQLDFLINSDCDNLQGFLLCKPIREKEIVTLTKMENTGKCLLN